MFFSQRSVKCQNYIFRFENYANNQTKPFLIVSYFRRLTPTNGSVSTSYNDYVRRQFRYVFRSLHANVVEIDSDPRNLRHVYDRMGTEKN